MLMLLFTVATQAGGAAVANSPPVSGQYWVVPVGTPSGGIVMAQPAPGNAPPPVITPTPPQVRSRPISLDTQQPVLTPDEQELAKRRIDPVEVTILVDGKPLWSGTLNVSAYKGGRYQETLTGAGATEACPSPQGAEIGYSLTLSVGKYAAFGSSPEHFRLNVNLQRSSPSFDCKNTSTRTVMLEEQAALERGQTVELRGEGGLVARIRRR